MTLHLASPHTRGPAVEKLQRAINRRGHGRPGAIHVRTDGEYGRDTANAEAQIAHLLGVLHSHDHERAQQVILHPALRTPFEYARARKAVREAKKRLTSGPGGAVALALKLAHRVPRIIENPPSSNTDRGGLIDQMQREVGLHAGPWCGCAAHYIVLHGGGVNLSPGIVYCPTTEQLARTGTGGFLKWIPAGSAKSAPVGSLVLYDEGGIAGHVGVLVSKSDGSTVHTVEGNTSGDDGGSQSNGGGLFERHRPIKGGFPVRGFAVPRWH